MTTMSAVSAGVPRESVRRVLVVDDHTTFAQLLARALATEPDIECVGQCQTAEHARQLVAVHDPDVVITDVRLGEGAEDGIELTRHLVDSRPGLVVIVLSAFADGDLVERAADAGAAGVVPKNGRLDEMLGVLRRAAPGGVVLPPQLVEALLARQRTQVPSVLTPRELDVLELLAQGLDMKAICRRLGITVNTGRGYVKALLVKLDAHTQLEAVVAASRRGLIRLGPR